MARIKWLALILIVVLHSCGLGTDPGSFTMSFTWGETKPEGTVWIWVRVEERLDPAKIGTILASAGPGKYVFGEELSLEMDQVPNGTDRYVIAEVREGANPGLPILYYGISEMFELAAGKHTHVDVPMTLQIPEAQSVTASVSMLFDGEVKDNVGLTEIINATIVTESVHAVSVVLANDAGFSANATEVPLETGDQMTCIEEDAGDLVWDICQYTGWNLLTGLFEEGEEPQDQQFTVFIKFIDRNGYESQVYRVSVVLDSGGPQVIVASLTPQVAFPGSEVFLSVTFHEALAAKEGAGVLTVTPGLPDGSVITGPERVGTSTAYVWNLSLAEEWGPDDVFTFAVDTIDILDNEAPGQSLTNSDGDDLTLTIDPVSPALVQDVGEPFNKDLFGLPDAGTELTFEFVIHEENPHELEADADGLCQGICPSVRLGTKSLGLVYLNSKHDNAEENQLGFSFKYVVTPEDFTKKDSELEASVLWTDKAGNGMEELLPGTLHFDFQPPTALSCSLVPEFGNATSVFTYTLTASEVLAEEPELNVESDTGGLFTDPPQMEDNGQTYKWQQAAENIPSQDFTLSARLIDMAGNVSETDNNSPYVCPVSAAVDGEPPLLSDNPIVTTEPIVLDDFGVPIVACGDGYILKVAFDVSEAKGIKEGYPDVRLAVPGQEIPLEEVLVQETGENMWHYEFALTMSAETHFEAQGLWPVRVTLQDNSLNETVIDNLGEELVKVDFEPPQAECSLMPTVMENGYNIGQKVMLQVFPLEKVPAGFIPQLTETTDPQFDGPFFTFETGSKFRFARTILPTDGELDFSVSVSLTDLVGNTTPVDETACSGGDQLAGPVDGLAPIIHSVVITVDSGDIDPAVTPLMAGRTVTVAVQSSGSPLPPEMLVGKGPLELTSQIPTDLGEGLLEWTLTRVLDGSEGDGIQYVQGTLKDKADNSTSHVENLQPLTLDFTAPVAQCKMFPADAKVGDTITVAISTSEPLKGGKPALECAELVFIEPEPDLEATTFDFKHMVTIEDAIHTSWNYMVSLTDLAGNTSSGEVCTGGGNIDADPPTLTDISVWTDPGVDDIDGQPLLAVGPGDKLLVTFTILESQSVPADGVHVFVDIPGAPVTLPAVTFEPGAEGSFIVLHELIFEPDDYPDPQAIEGNWPIKAQVEDVAGNITTSDGLGGELLRIDFTPPVAECSLIPAYNDVPFGIGQKLLLQVSALETLLPGSPPLVEEGFEPDWDETLFAFVEGTKFRFAGTIEEGDGERTVALHISLTDLVGNTTPVDGSGCVTGQVQFAVDGLRPEVSEVLLAVDQADTDPLVEPLRAGLELSASITVFNSALEPEVTIGEAAMTAAGPVSEGPDDTFTWTFVRVLDGLEGEGLLPIIISGEDEAGNIYLHDDPLLMVLTDFTPPSALCTVLPGSARLGAEITLTIATSEPLATGLPEISSSLILNPPVPAPDGTDFIYSYTVSPLDSLLTDWTYSLTLTDLAGNPNDGDSACAGGGQIDAVPPAIIDSAITTAPQIINHLNKVVPVAGHDGSVEVMLLVAEAQAVAPDFPEVALDIPGKALQLSLVDSQDNGDGTIQFQFARQLDKDGDSYAEGTWPVRVTVTDVAGNSISEEALAETFVRIDFTPPDAECSLIPAPGATAYPLGQTVVLQVSPLEELKVGLEPVLVELLDPEAPDPFFSFDEGTKYRFTGQVEAKYGETQFTVAAILEDLVGNITPDGGNACSEVITAALDGTAPTVSPVVITVDNPAINPSTQPLRAGLEITATFTVTNTDIEPTVVLGDVSLDVADGQPVELGNGTWEWSFSRTLDGSEGDGLRKITVSGEDEAGNTYSYTETDNTVTLDFTPPTSVCTVNPEYARLGDTVTLKVEASEPLEDGLPMLDSPVLVFMAPPADPNGTVFLFSHPITIDDAGITDWTYSVTLTDLAGNPQTGLSACSSTAKVDAVPPALEAGATVTTTPVVLDNNDAPVLAVGDGDTITATFTVTETQGLAQGFPAVYLDVVQGPLAFTQVALNDNGNGTFQCQFELVMDAAEHAAAEGPWPVRVELADLAGNTATIDALLPQDPVLVDFTPPGAQCSLIPAPGDNPYPIGQKVVLQVFPYEQLMTGTLPELSEVLTPDYDGPLFQYEADTNYSFSHTIDADDGEHNFQVKVHLTDRVGNQTPPGQNACAGGVLTGAIDGQVPQVESITLEVEGGLVDPAATPLKAGLEVVATITIDNTDTKPEVMLGAGVMTADAPQPTDLGNGTYQWAFARILDGSEGEGIRKISVSGSDAAGNAYVYTEEDNTVTLDFTAPTAHCTAFPSDVKAGDTITVTVNVSEVLKDGIPGFISQPLFLAPDPDADALTFEYSYEVKEGDDFTSWEYSVTVTDRAGNQNAGQFACNDGGDFDAIAPVIHTPVLTTDPVVTNSDNDTVSAVGDTDRVIAVFQVTEAQNLADGYPLVTLDTAKGSLSFVLENEEALGQSNIRYTYSLTIDGAEHAAYEGTWPVRVVTLDEAGNQDAVAALADTPVTVDLTAPRAECSLVPAPDGTPYPIGQKVIVQVFPYEALATGEEPDLIATFTPPVAGDYFTYEQGTTYSFAKTVDEGDGERDFKVRMVLTDLVGNQTAPDGNACSGGLLSGAIDGEIPAVDSVTLEVEGGVVNPAKTPLKAGFEVKATTLVNGTNEEPTVTLGDGLMALDSGPVAQGGGIYQWIFKRTLDGSEGEGIRKITVAGTDAAGNSYSYTEPDNIVTLDFTAPTAQCSANPTNVKSGDTVFVTVNASELLGDGLPEWTSSPAFTHPPADPDGTSFIYNHTFDDGDQALSSWSYSVVVTDLAGNQSKGQSACSGGGTVDAFPPVFNENTDQLSTSPVVTDHDGVTVLAAGDGDSIIATFTVTEDQGLANGYPQVYLDVTGDPIALSKTGEVSLGGNQTQYTFTLVIDEIEHLSAEGAWPVRAVLADTAGNTATDGTVGDTQITVDLTPPAAECSLVPSPDGTPYPIGQKIILQVFPYEELMVGTVPSLDEDFTPAFAGDFFTYDTDTSYSFSHTISASDGEHSFAVSVRLTDLVGNQTPVDQNACTGGQQEGTLDGQAPTVSTVTLTVDSGAVDPATTPLKIGRVVDAIITINNSAEKPDVLLGTVVMTETHPTAVSLGGDQYKWTFRRTLDGSEGDGERKVTINGSDDAGNAYSHTEEDNTVTLDFTAPTAQCTAFPEDVKLGDSITVAVNVSELLSDGLPAFTSTLSFTEPDADPQATSFEYGYDVGAGDAGASSWTFGVVLEDLAGNRNTGQYACSGGGTIDAEAPVISADVLTTIPQVVDGDNDIVLIAGDNHIIQASFRVEEDQALAVGYPEVSLEAAGESLAFSKTSETALSDTVTVYKYQLAIDAVDHADYEGSWSVRARVQDTAGNSTADEAVGGEVVTIDLTPPRAECSLVPTPDGDPYPIGQKVIIQVFPYEELVPGEPPSVVESFTPALQDDFFSYEADTSYLFSNTIEEGDGERDFTVRVRLEDLVGNATSLNGNACTSGLLSASIDGETPSVDSVTLEVEAGAVDPDVIPLRAGLEVEATILLNGTDEEPTVTLGDGSMAVVSGPVNQGAGSYQWVFSRTLDGTEGEGLRKVKVTGTDTAGNAYTYTEEDNTTTLDFTAPSGQCSANPTNVKEGDTVFVTVNASEPLLDGIPTFTSTPGFTEPPADPDGTSFIYNHNVDAGDASLTTWSYAVVLTDRAGNHNSGQYACSGGGTIDAFPPEISDNNAISTSPEVVDHDNDVVLAVGDGDTIIATFIVTEDQGLANGYPQVHLDVTGDPIAFTETSKVALGGNNTRFTFQLPIDEALHADSEGVWWVRAVVADTAGNVDTESSLSDEQVTIDLTPPAAVCSLVPSPDADPYPISQKIILQVFPYEELMVGTVPSLDEDFTPAFGGDFFTYDADTSYSFSHTISAADGEHDFSVSVQLTDLVGNQTPADGNACAGGALSGSIDGEAPSVASVSLSVDAGVVDPSTTPLKVGRVIDATIVVANTDEQPTVTLGTVSMTALQAAPTNLGGGQYQWIYRRTLDGTEGEGVRKVAVNGEDAAGNTFTYTEEDKTVTLDFTLPTAQCTSFPSNVKLGDGITVAVNVSELIADGLPEFASNLAFAEPGADPEATSFEYTYTVDAGDAGKDTWTYGVILEDLAGNQNAGQYACSGSGTIDAEAPSISADVLSTLPEVTNSDDEVVLVAGDSYLIQAAFRITEDQAIASGYPQAYLDVTGDSLAFTKISETSLGNDVTAYVFQLLVNAADHAEHEGTWSVRAVVQDTAGNSDVDSAIGDDVVEIDLSAPLAECNLVPAPSDTAYPIDQKVVVQVFPYEELSVGEVPVLVETFSPVLGVDYFAYEHDSSYLFSNTVQEGDGERDFSVRVRLEDLVGNSTTLNGNACTDGALSGSIDGTTPTVDEVTLEVEGGTINPATTPLRSGLEVFATIDINGTDEEPSVTIGKGTMAVVSGPIAQGGDVYRWVFNRTLNGTEGEGLRKVKVTGEDAAGNAYTYTENANTATLDFTAPSAECSSFPVNLKKGDAITLSVSTSETLLTGLPQLTSNLSFNPPQADPDATSFSYTYTVGGADVDKTGWNYAVVLYDKAGNKNNGASACSGGGIVDAKPPVISNHALATDPVVVNSDGETVLAVGDTDTIVATFQVAESQGMAPGYPQVFLSVAGDSIAFEQTGTEDLGNDTTQYTYELTIDAVEHAAYEGSWPVRASARDVATNTTIETAVGNDVVQIDLTPPLAECNLSPPSLGNDYPIGQIIAVQIFPYEELKVGDAPNLIEYWNPSLGDDYFTYIPSSNYVFANIVQDGDGERDFALRVRLEDLVGNITPILGNACTDGAITGSIDAVTPTVSSVVLEVNDGTIDHATVPLKAGRDVEATIRITNTSLKPTVTLGLGTMSKDSGPLHIGGGVYQWVFSRTLNGTEGEGVREVTIEGEDAAGNEYSYTEEDDVVTLDFTLPTAQCSFNPPKPKLNDVIVLTVTSSEYVQGGLPNLTSSLAFNAPDPSLTGVSFEYGYPTSAADTDIASWTYGVEIFDVAGNKNTGIYACAGSGPLDAKPPLFSNAVITTDPVITNAAGNTERIVGDGGTISIAFDIVESKGIQSGYPEVFLNVGGAPVEMTLISGVYAGSDTYNYVFELEADEVTHDSVEGTWSIRGVARDVHGNTTIEDGLGSSLVTLDFTPPQAECSLVPVEPADAYPIGQKVTVQVSPLEELTLGTIPLIIETFTPVYGGDTFFEFENDTHYLHSHTIEDGDGEHKFTVKVRMSDLVGNITPLHGNACQGGVLDAHIDGTRPEVQAVSVTPNDDSPQRVGQTVGATIDITNGGTQPDVQIGTGAMTWVPPLVPLPNDLYRWSFSRVLDGTEGDGDQEVNVTGEDEAGNTYSYTEEINTLNLDFTNPTASCFVNNNYAKAGDDVNAVIIMSEPEQSGYYFSMITGGLDFNYNASLSNPDLANPRFVYSFTVAEDQPYKSWSGRFYAKDVAGNPASGSYLCNVSGKVDGTSITLSNTDAYAMYYDSDDHTWVNTGAHAKSSSRAYATFRVNSAPASGTMHVYIGSTEMTNYTIPSKYTYLYWYNLDSLGSHGDVLPITVEMEDAAGNITFETLGSLTLDYVVPDTSGTPYFERCDAYTDARLDQNSIWIMEDGYDCSYSYIPTSCGLTGDKFTGEVKIAFGIAEPIDLDELVITVDDYSLTVDRCLSSTTYVVALFSPAGSEPQGAGYSVLAHLEDQAGNQDDVTLGTFWFDFIAPSTPKVDTLDRIRYTRAPWGNSTTSGTKRFLVYGTTGAVENDSRILVYDGEDVADASLIGETESGGTGAFGGSLGSGNEFYLNAADRAEVFITTVDTAGNWSDDDNGSAGIQATKVRDVIWYATPGQKVGGSYLENPHTFEATDWFQPQLYQNDVDELGADAGIDLSGGSSFTSTGTDLSWAIRTRSSSFDPSARFGPAMAYDSSRGRVVLFGGDADIYPYNDTWEWTGSRWVQILPSDPEDDGNPTGRVNAAMAFDSKRGRIVMFGGLYVTDNNETWEYDGTSWELITPTDPEGDGSPAADSDVAMAYDSGRGVTVLFTTDGALLNPSPQTWEYDGTSWDLITLSDPEGDGNPACRTSTAMTYDPGANEMVLFGGSPCASSTPLGDTWLYDGTSWDKVTPASNPDARKASKMVYDADEDRVVLFGGRKKSGISWVRLNDTWEWSGSNWALQTPTDPEGDGSPSTRYSHGMAYDTAREETIIFGGQTTDWVKETWAWNGASWVKRGPINPTGYDLPGVKMQTAATFMQDTNETVILGGGAVENSASDETWIFNNVGWDYQYPVSDPEGDDDPAARGRSTLTYNDDLNAAFLFGGYSPKGFYSDGWWWTGSSWAKITFGDPNGDGSPGARASHAMTYDTDRNVFVLYGGDDPNSPQHMNDTWEMSRYAVYWPIYMIIHEWTLKSPAFVPGPRRDQTMVYDTKRDVTVMSFGRSLTLSPTSYEWNGTNWTLVQPTDPEDDGNPEPRFGHCMAYDTDWQRSIVFGGEGYAVYGDCWEFDGTSWRQLLTSDPEGDGDPAGRKYASLVYDEKYQHLLLIGGNNGGDETWAGIRSTDDRPGHVFSTYFSAAGHDTMPDIKRVTVRWRAAGKSWYSMSSGYYNGARLHLWDEGKWNSVDTNSTSLSSASQLDWTTTNAEILNRIFFDSDRQTLVFGVTPKYYSYRNRSQVKTDSVEVEVQYRLDE